MKLTLGKQQSNGYTLFVSMILLTILSTIGVSAMRDTLLEERMSFNFQDKHTAFQAAESALVYAERIIMRGQSVDEIESEAGYVDKTSIASTLNWDNATLVPLKSYESYESKNSTASSALSANPLIKIEFIHAVDSKTTGRNPEKNPEADLRYYRVSARAQGLTVSSIEFTQNVLER